MKKVITTIVVFLVALFMFDSVYATTITLEQIVEKFNKSSIVDNYKSTGGSINATSDNDSINITASTNGKTYNVELLLDGNILSIEIDGEEEQTAFLTAYITLQVVDIIGQLHGYEAGELAQTLNSEGATNYTLEKEGYQVEKISETKFKIKVDITKKIPLLDFSNTYIEVDDLEDLKKYIYGDGFATTRKGNVYFNKSGYDGEYILLVAEKGDLTENTYKSILSIIQVMFESNKASDYFKSNYSGISIGNKEFSGFKIEINPIKTESEERSIPSDSGYKLVRITIDKNLANLSINGITDKKNNNDTTEEDNNKVETINHIKVNDNTQSSEKIPQTGEDMTMIIGIIALMILSVFMYKKYSNYKDIK